MEKTYSLFILKPGFLKFEKALLNILEDNKIKVVAMKKSIIPEHEIEAHYKEHFGKPFYNNLVAYMSQGFVAGYKFDPTTILLLISSEENETEDDFITRTRALVKGILRPEMQFQRNDFPEMSDERFKELMIMANGIHASDSAESAKREVLHFFPNFVID